MFHSLFLLLLSKTSNNNCPNHAMHNPFEKSCHLCLESWESSQISWWQQQKRLTTDTSSGISLKGSPERSLTYGGTISVKILCCVRKQKRVNLQCIKYLLNATCHSVFSHKKSSKVCLLETKQFSSFHFVHVDLFLARKQCLSLV